MIKLNSKRVYASEISEFSWYADLIDFDGPLLSLFRGAGYKDALYVWLDNSERANRWCLVPVSREMLDDYLTQQTSLRETITSNHYIYICNHFAESGRKVINKILVSDFPADYMPDEDSYLYEEICTPEALSLKNERTSSYMLGLDNQLFINDLSIIPKVYDQLYSFHYGLAHLDRSHVRETMKKLFGSWTGGISAVNIFTGLKNTIPVIHQPEIESLQFSSPGHIELSLLPALAQSVEEVSSRVENEHIFNRLEKLYKVTKDYLKLQGLSGFDEDGGIDLSNIPNEVTLILSKLVRLFILFFGWKEYQEKFDEIGSHPLQQLRAIMAYYRRLKILRNYILDEKLYLGHSRLTVNP
ncbi:DUF6575 domain-containing protein [Erwinia sp. HDF1-3R]|uniref:DUF6575 domain-containing protein n=1 Tax=Erwinia sp. HDF1-3R TaxID=3141543 RepID=UPI0031F5AD18